MSYITETISQFSVMVRNMGAWLDEAAALAKQKSFEPDNFVMLRLAPDQYPLARQVQSACDTAKFAAARLSGKEPPSHPDTEKTLAELRERTAICGNYLEGFQASDFADAADRRISLPWMQGKWLTGNDYLLRFAIPNFYFHTTTTYAILRHNGVNLGKRAFLGSMPMRD